MSYTCSVTSLPYCCGFHEAGNFGDDYENDYDCDSPEELLEEILKNSDGRPVSFNFVNYANAVGAILGNFHYDELRQLVLKHKNVIDLGEHTNPSTRNRIHSLIIKDYK